MVFKIESVFDKFIFNSSIQYPSWFYEQVGKQIILKDDEYFLENEKIEKGNLIALLSDGTVCFLSSDKKEQVVNVLSDIQEKQLDVLFNDLIQLEIHYPDDFINQHLFRIAIEFLDSKSFSLNVLLELVNHSEPHWSDISGQSDINWENKLNNALILVKEQNDHSELIKILENFKGTKEELALFGKVLNKR